MQIDWSKTAGTFETLPQGNYLVTIDGWKKSKAKTSGNDMIEWDATVSSGTHEGAPVKDWITLTEASMWRLATFISNALSIEAADLPAMDTDSTEFTGLLNACKGKKMYWSLIVDSYNGQQRNKLAQKDPYAAAKGNAPFNLSDISDVPSWVKEAQAE